jgi:lysylphosphatidylglycerol synthetase-like protein (DUF2156 family)
MDAALRLTLAAIFFLLLSLVAVATLVYFLRKLTVEYAKAKSDGVDQHWWRFVVPTLLAVIAAVWIHLGGALWYQWLYLIIPCIAIPMAISFFLLRDTLEQKIERLSMLAALLLFLNASIYACLWYWHYHHAHASDIDAGNFENPHIVARNYFFIPLWIVTILVGGAAGYLWRKENRKGNDELLPYYSAE